MPNDETLMARVEAGDESAFDLLFSRHEATVRRRLMAVVRDEATVADLTQEVFLRLWTRAEQYRGGGSVAGWLLRTATNLALNHLRSTNRRRTRSLDASPRSSADQEEAAVPASMIDDAALGPDALAEQAETYRALRSLVDDLPDTKREVVELWCDEETDIATIAERLGIAPGTVKSRLHYARNRLTRRWKQITDPEEPQ